MIRKKTETGWWEGELQASIDNIFISTVKKRDFILESHFSQARGQKRQIGWFPASYVKLLGSSSNRSTPVSHRYQDSPTDPNIGESYSTPRDEGLFSNVLKYILSVRRACDGAVSLSSAQRG